MFEHLLDLSESKRTMDEYRVFVDEITHDYFNSGQTPTEGVFKVASIKGLQPHQVEILVAETNKNIHIKKYASADEKYFAADFPLADAKAVIMRLQAGSVKTASANHFISPQVPKTEVDMYEMFGVKPVEMDKTASVKHQLKTAEQKSELLQQKLGDAIMIKEAMVTNSQHNFIKMARQMVIQESGHGPKIKIIDKLGHFVKSANFKKEGYELLGKLAYVLNKEGQLEFGATKRLMEYFLSKEADQKAPEELISQDLPAQIINGQHPLYITIKTIADNSGELARFRRQSGLVDDKVRILRQRIRAL